MDTSTKPQDHSVPHQEIGIFWDYENVRIPSGDQGRAQHLSDKLQTLLMERVPNGRVVQMDLFFDNSKDGASFNKTALSMGGWNLNDCPTRNCKETLDKQIIVDLILFATRGNPCQKTVVLISGDGDYAYMLSKLNGLRVKTIIVFPVHVTACVLLQAASVSICWETEILGTEILQTELAHAERAPSEIVPAEIKHSTTLFDPREDDTETASAPSDASESTSFDLASSSLEVASSQQQESDLLTGQFDTFLSAIENECTPPGWGNMTCVLKNFFRRKGLLKGNPQRSAVLTSRMVFSHSKRIAEFGDQNKRPWDGEVTAQSLPPAEKGQRVIAFVRLTALGLTHLHRNDPPGITAQ